MSKSNLRAAADRPVATGVGAAFVIGILFLTWMGFAGTLPYGDVVIVPDRKLTAVEAAGLRAFSERECAYCHQILGKGGRKEGPDLSNVLAKDRTKEWLTAYIKDPGAVSGWTSMPKYDLTQKELESLVAFILSLDFDQYRSKVVRREEILEDKKEPLPESAS